MADTYYVYVLLRENGVPFYIGMGHGYRWSEHEKSSKHKNEKSHKANIVREFKRKGLRVPKVKLEENLSHEEAVRLEIRLIALLGREPNGPLTNLTAGGEGRYGHIPSQETRAKMRAAKLGKKITFTEEHRALLSVAAKLRMIKEPGQFASAAKKSSGATGARARELNRQSHLGKKRSPESLRKFRETMSLRRASRG